MPTKKCSEKEFIEAFDKIYTGLIEKFKQYTANLPTDPTDPSTNGDLKHIKDYVLLIHANCLFYSRYLSNKKNARNMSYSLDEEGIPIFYTDGDEDLNKPQIIIV